MVGEWEREKESCIKRFSLNNLNNAHIATRDAPELSRLIHSYGGQPVGSIALRSDYLPLELVGHTPADVTTPMADKFNQLGLPWNEPLYADLSNVKSPVASRRTPSPILTNKVTHYRRKTGHHHEHDRYPHPCEYPESLYEVVFSHRGSAPHALFMDCTHDNETPLQKRIGEDTLCTGALLCMANCAVGSVRGYDELVPKHLNVVQETRRYRKDTLDLGIGKVKAVLQRLHYLISQKGYSEVHVHQEREFISVNRQNPFTHHGYLLIANTAFRRHDDVGSRDFSGVPGMNIDIFIHRRIISQVSPIVLRNSSFKTILAARIRVHPDRFERDPNTITGVPCDLEIAEREPLPDMVSIESGKDDRGHFFSITPRHFPCGSVLLLELDLLPESFRALDDLKASLNMTVQGTWYLDGIIRTGVPGLKEALAELTLLELNVALYRCEDEERDFTSGQHGVYHVPGHGPLAYAGLQGIATVLRGIARANNLGHPMCEHLRQGMWLGTYTTDRLKRYAVQYPSLFPLIDWLDQRFALVRNLPSHLTPKYFNIVVLTVWNECVQRALQLMRPEFKCDTWFTRMLGRRCHVYVALYSLTNPNYH